MVELSVLLLLLLLPHPSYLSSLRGSLQTGNLICWVWYLIKGIDCELSSGLQR